MQVNSTFDPGQHLSKVKGQDYLEVKWRVAWLRAEHPDAILETDLRVHENGRAVFWARVALPAGAVATGWGSETIDAFENYIEKAETKAIGRALAGIGYGTQFAVEFDDGGIVDGPVKPQGQQQGQQSGPGPARGQYGAQNRGGGGNGGFQPPSAAQRNKATVMGQQLHISPDEMEKLCHEVAGVGWDDLSKAQISKVIDALEARQGRQGGYR